MSEKSLKERESSSTALDAAREKTRRFARNLWQLVARHASIGRLEEERPQSRAAPPRFEYKARGWLLLLSAVPYLLLALFAVSFFWDFQGVEAELFGMDLRFQGLLKILSISGLIGFMTNWLAITMLFKPAQRRPILGYGLIPAQKDRIAWRLAETVAEDLINPDIIKQKIHESKAISRYREQATRYVKGIIDDPVFREELKHWVVEYVDEMIANPEIRAAIAEKILLQIEEALENKAVEKVALKAYSYIRGQQMQEIIEEALTQLPASVESGLDKLDDLLDRLPETIDRHSDAIENLVTSLLYKLINQLDVKALVEDNLKSYDEQKLSDIIRNATNEQLRYIQYLGAVLGTVGGFVIWEPLLSLAVLGVLTCLLLLTDQLLFSLSRPTR